MTDSAAAPGRAGASTLVLAHRGSGPAGPERENTMAALEAAVRLGADGVEVDVRRSRDGHLVLSHDAVLYDGRLICETDAAGLPSDMASLEEALSFLSGVVVNLEVKNVPGDPDYDPSELVARRVAELVSAPVAEDISVVVSSFSRRALQAVGDLAPRLERAFLYGPVDVRAAPRLALQAGVDGLHPHDSLVTGELVATARLAGLAIRVWTVSRAGRIAELGRLGVDAVVTDDVATALSALGRLAKGSPGREQSGP